ncbi:MAG: hypothetical protein ACSLFQ_03725 [Thermoanaerobaculia bacterium]
MKLLTRLLLASALVVVFGTVPAFDASAQIAEASFLRIAEPLDVGGTLLQPGTYVIRLLPSISNRNLIQVTNEDRSEIFATVLSIPHHSAVGEDTPSTEFVLYPQVEGTHRALRTWFSADPVSKGGHDIVYPERRAMEIAPLVHEPVYAYRGEPKAEVLPAAPIVVVTPTKEVIVWVEPKPAPRPVVVARATELPATASNLPLFATIGLLLIGVAFAIRALRVA